MPTTPTSEVRRFARRWASSLTGAVAPAMSRAEIEQMLGRLTATLVDAVGAAADADALGRQVGARLIEANYRDAAVLNHTVRLLATDFVPDLGDPPARRDRVTVRDRVAALQGAVAEGFTTAMRQRLLAEQQATQRAALAAAAAAEERRRASEARFQAVFAEAAVGIGTVGLDGIVLDVNSALADMLGLPPERITGRTVAEVIGAGISRPGVYEVSGSDRRRGGPVPPRDGPYPSGWPSSAPRPVHVDGSGRHRCSAVPDRGGGRHHRAPAVGGSSVARGAARLADRSAQPHPVLRAPRQGAGATGGVLYRPRRIQERQ